MNEPAAPEQEQPRDETSASHLDLDAIDADLDGVERALARLADGSYWTDEVTGAPLDESFLADHPTARRAPA